MQVGQAVEASAKRTAASPAERSMTTRLLALVACSPAKNVAGRCFSGLATVPPAPADLASSKDFTVQELVLQLQQQAVRQALEREELLQPNRRPSEAIISGGAITNPPVNMGLSIQTTQA